MRELIVVGSGGFGREVLDVARDQGRVIRGVADDFPSPENLRLLAAQHVQLLGTTEEVIASTDPSEVEFVIGIGNGAARARIDKLFSDAGFTAGVLIHSTASFGFDVQTSPGVVVCAGARVTTHVALGRHCHLNLNTTVGHDCVIADYVTVNPGSAISGYVEIGEAALIGAHAFIKEKTSVGAHSVVGAGSAVVKPVPERTTVVGIPARELVRG